MFVIIEFVDERPHEVTIAVHYAELVMVVVLGGVERMKPRGRVSLKAGPRQRSRTTISSTKLPELSRTIGRIQSPGLHPVRSTGSCPAVLKDNI